MSQAFVDADGDALTYTVSSSSPQVVTALVAGARVRLTAAGEGTATIRVTATDPGGLSATQSFTVTVSTMVPGAFTDDPIQPGVTPVRAVHFRELRSRIDDLRAGTGLGRFAWTDPVPAGGGDAGPACACAGAAAGAGRGVLRGGAGGPALDRRVAGGGVDSDPGGARDGASRRGPGAGVRRPRLNGGC